MNTQLKKIQIWIKNAMDWKYKNNDLILEFLLKKEDLILNPHNYENKNT